MEVPFACSVPKWLQQLGPAQAKFRSHPNFMWLIGTWIFGNSLFLFGWLTRGWVRSSAAGIGTATLIWDSSVARWFLTYWAVRTHSQHQGFLEAMLGLVQWFSWLILPPQELGSHRGIFFFFFVLDFTFPIQIPICGLGAVKDGSLHWDPELMW